MNRTQGFGQPGTNSRHLQGCAEDTVDTGQRGSVSLAVASARPTLARWADAGHAAGLAGPGPAPPTGDVTELSRAPVSAWKGALARISLL